MDEDGVCTSCHPSEKNKAIKKFAELRLLHIIYIYMIWIRITVVGTSLCELHAYPYPTSPLRSREVSPLETREQSIVDRDGGLDGQECLHVRGNRGNTGPHAKS